MPVITKFLDRRSHGSTNRRTKKRKRQDSQAQSATTRDRERKFAQKMALLGVPKIPEDLRRRMELGHEPTEAEQEAMAPFIKAAAEQLKELHYQDMRSRKFLHTKTRRSESDDE